MLEFSLDITDTPGKKWRRKRKRKNGVLNFSHMT
jgi:hypothetical protein